MASQLNENKDYSIEEIKQRSKITMGRCKTLFDKLKRLEILDEAVQKITKDGEGIKNTINKNSKIVFGIQEKYRSISLKSQCQIKLDETNTFFRDIADKKSWIEEKKLHVAYQQFIAKIEKEKVWITEKQQSLNCENGENMAACYSLLRKHVAFEEDFAKHNEVFIKEICHEGDTLVKANTNKADAIHEHCLQLQIKFEQLGSLATSRKKHLLDNVAYFQFMCKVGIVESWIANKEKHIWSQRNSRDLASRRTLISRLLTFDAGSMALECEGIENITIRKEKMIQAGHEKSIEINKRYVHVINRWQKLIATEELFLSFAKKASAFNSRLENAKKHLTEPICCNSIEEIEVIWDAHLALVAGLSSTVADFQELKKLSHQIRIFNCIRLTMRQLQRNCFNLQMIIRERDLELIREAERQRENDELREEFAEHINNLHKWLTDMRTSMVTVSGTFEEQLKAIKIKLQELQVRQKEFKTMQDCSAILERHLTLFNKYTTNSAVDLVQQWNQLNELGVQMQRNLEQRI